MPPAAENYIFVDSIPEVAEWRAQERETAWELLEERRARQLAGIEATLPPVDALSTAYAVLDAPNDVERDRRYDGLVQDSQRLVAEWYRKNKAEYFPALRHTFDATSESFFSHGFSIRQMTENALRPISDSPEEEARRVNERVEDATPLFVKKAMGGLALGRTVLTISECTDQAIEEYEHDQRTKAAHRGYGGYVPEIQKLMVRGMYFEEGSDDRFEVQVGARGSFLTHEIIQMTLEREGLEAAHLDKTSLHGAQILTSDSPMGFLAKVDTMASEQWCTNVFMGEEVPDDFVKDYDAFQREAIERQTSLEDHAKTVANFVIDLARDDVDRVTALTMVEDFVKKLLLNVAKDNIDLAETMFDRATADGLREVAYLESIGQQQAAFARMEQVEAQAPGGGYCGAGSCGLESVNTSSKEGQDLMRKLGARSGDTIVSDKVRACKCGSRTIKYAYNANKVNKYCESCGRFESKSGAALKSR